MENTFVIGQQVLVSLAATKGMGIPSIYWVGGGIRSAAVVERVEPCTVFVRLTGLVPAPYSAGLYLPLDPGKVEPMKGW